MPVIPTYKQRDSIPGDSGNTLMNVGSAGVVGNAIAESGEVLGRALELHRQKNDNELIEAGSKVNDEILTFERQEKEQYQGKDAAGSQARTSAFAAYLQEKYKLPFKDSDFKLKQHILSHTDALKNRLASREAAEIQKSANIARSMDLDSSVNLAASGNVDIAMANYAKTLKTQLDNRSLSKDEYELEKKHGSSAILSAYLEGLMTTDPIGADKVFKVVANDLTAKDRARLEGRVKAEAVNKTALDIATDIFKSDDTGKVEAMTDKIDAMKLPMAVRDEAVKRLEHMFVKRHNDQKMAADKAEDEAAQAYASGKPINWRSLSEASPKYAMTLKDKIERDAKQDLAIIKAEKREERAIAAAERQAAADEIKAIRDGEFLKKLDQSANFNNLLLASKEDITPERIREDFASGAINREAFEYFQKKYDPEKNEVVVSAIKQIRSGSAIRDSLKLKNTDSNEVKIWEAKYSDLVRTFAKNHINEPDFDKKMTEYMEKYVLSDMVKDWDTFFKSTARLEKFSKAEKAAGPSAPGAAPAPQQKAEKGSPPPGYPTEPPVPGAIKDLKGQWVVKRPDGKHDILLFESYLKGASPDAGKKLLRHDGKTFKGNGFLGPLKMKDGSGKVASEMSIGVEIEGKEVDIPMLVPTLTKTEIDFLLEGNKPTDKIINKAIEFAEKRIKAGKSPFAEDGTFTGGVE